MLWQYSLLGTQVWGGQQEQSWPWGNRWNFGSMAKKLLTLALVGVSTSSSVPWTIPAIVHAGLAIGSSSVMLAKAKHGSIINRFLFFGFNAMCGVTIALTSERISVIKAQKMREILDWIFYNVKKVRESQNQMTKNAGKFKFLESCSEYHHFVQLTFLQLWSPWWHSSKIAAL